MTTVEAIATTSTARQATVGLWGIGTAVPPSVRQADLIEPAEELGCRSDGERAFLRRVFTRSGVSYRGSVLAKDAADARAQMREFYPARQNETDLGPTTGQRMLVYAREAPPLLERAARSAIDNAAVNPDTITHLITVSCTGFFAPGLDVEMIRRLRLRPDVRRTHIGFMGCHAAFNALGEARAIVAADPAAVVLVCCVELCTLHFAYGWSMEKVVANALFADGAAAAVIGEASGDRGHWLLKQTASALLPDTLSAMTWKIADHGFEMTLSAELPAIVQSNLHAWCNEWLDLAAIKSWAVHPGGPKVLTAVEAALHLDPAALGSSRAILAEHGNMSSTTILFILDRMAREGASSPCAALGFGPGLMMEGMLLERQ